MTNSAVSVAEFDLWIDGRPVPADSGRTFERTNPFDGSTAGRFANASVEDAERAVASSRAAFDSGTWSTSPARQRHDVLLKLARLVESSLEDIAQRAVIESGKPISLARGEVQGAVKSLEFFAGLTLSAESSAISDRNPGALGLVLREPVGVAGLITPWNFPILNPVQKVAAALAAGCTMVLKPSHLCSGPAVLIAQLASDAGLPDGVFNLLTSDIERGATAGEVLSGSPLVDKVAVTGSTATGQAVMKSASATTKRLALELGGKSANIVFEDADLDAAARTAISAFCFNSGQQCSAGSRLLLQRSVHDEFMELLVGYAKNQVLGDPQDPATTMGPLVSQDQFARVMGYVDLGETLGRVAIGGGAPDREDLANGYFLEPTIFDGIDNSSRLAQEEVFGPVLAVVPFDTEDEAIALANDNPYGLAGGVWTSSIGRALRVTKAVHTGKMFVNSYNTAGIDDMPHGGYKQSGLGREGSHIGLDEFVELKTVQILL